MPRTTTPDRRKAVLDAALDAFGQAAYDDVSVSEVARTACVAQGLPFHYYGSKRGLYLAVVERVIAELDEVHPVPDGVAEPGAAVRDVLRRHVAFLREHPFAVALASSGAGLDPEVRSAVEQSRQRGAARTLATLGIERPGPAVQALARAWVAFLDQLVAQWLRDPPFGEADLIRVLCGSLADLLEAARPLEPETVALVSLAALRG
ncbi:MAG TPA: TetR/AcrR family transcriptional regulator [Trebonia sp.]|nr:TetR/AcrR family transcriptional regulator [Trebonia sp.]